VLDVPVPQVMLDGPGVLAVVSQLEAGRVSQHVRVDRHAQPGRFAGAGDQLAEGGLGHRRLALGDEDVRCLQVVAEQLAQGPDFRTAQRMGARQPVLAPSDMQKPLMQIDLLASQADQFRNAQSMPVGDQNHRGVPVAMASEPPGRDDEPVNLGRGQVLPAAALGIGLFGRRSHGERTFPKTIDGASVADAVRARRHLSSEQVTFPKRYVIGKVSAVFT